jgi:hypothetical protein
MTLGLKAHSATCPPRTPWTRSGRSTVIPRGGRHEFSARRALGSGGRRNRAARLGLPARPHPGGRRGARDHHGARVRRPQVPGPGPLRRALRPGRVRRHRPRSPRVRAQRRVAARGHRPVAAGPRLAPRDHLSAGTRGRRPQPGRHLGDQLRRRPRAGPGRQRPADQGCRRPGADRQRLPAGAAAGDVGRVAGAGAALRRRRCRAAPRRRARPGGRQQHRPRRARRVPRRGLGGRRPGLRPDVPAATVRRLRQEGHRPLNAQRPDLRRWPLGRADLPDAAADDHRYQGHHHRPRPAARRIRPGGRAEAAHGLRRHALRGLHRTLRVHRGQRREMVYPPSHRPRKITSAGGAGGRCWDVVVMVASFVWACWEPPGRRRGSDGRQCPGRAGSNRRR